MSKQEKDSPKQDSQEEKLPEGVRRTRHGNLVQNGTEAPRDAS